MSGITTEFSIKLEGPDGTIFYQKRCMVEASPVETWRDDAIMLHAAALLRSAITTRQAYSDRDPGE